MMLSTHLPLPDSPDYFPFRPGPFRQALGLRQVTDAEWIQIDRHYAGELAQKRAVLKSSRPQVFACADHAKDAAHELHDLLIDHLPAAFPAWFTRSGSKLCDAITGLAHSVSDAGTHPLEAASLLVQEDWCLMMPRDGAYKLDGACVCFPSRWSLPEMVGRSLLDIHAGVPRYADDAGAGADRFFERLEPGRLVERANWSLHDGDDLHRPTSPPMWPDAAPTADDAGDRVFLRVERQTLRRLPRTRAIAFSIRTYVRRLADVPDHAVPNLLGAVQNWPPEVVRYKGCDRSVGPTIAYLQRRAVGAG
jgi:hypothetical protein